MPAVTLARQAQRPTGREYIALLTDSFVELHGDRLCADSPSIIGGIAEFGGTPIMVVATQKGPYPRLAKPIQDTVGFRAEPGSRQCIPCLEEAFHDTAIWLLPLPGPG